MIFFVFDETLQNKVIKSKSFSGWPKIEKHAQMKEKVA